MYKVKETFEYLVEDCNDFCSVRDALEMDTSMPCPCWDGSKVPVNEKGEEEYIPWGNSTIEVINNAVSVNKDTLLQLIRDSEKLAPSDEIITATTIYCIAATIVNGIVYLYPQINYFYNFNNIYYVF